MPKRKLPPESQQSPATRRKDGAGPGGLDELCGRCSEVVAISRNPPVNVGGGIEIAPINEPVDQLGRSPCKFCRLLACIKQPSLDRADCRLYGFSANDVYAHARLPVLRKSGVGDSLLLGVLPASGKRPKGGKPSDFIGVVDSTRPGHGPPTYIGPRKIEPHKVDYSALKTWIAFCQSKHKNLCLSPSTKPPPFFRVFDTATRSVVPAPKDCEYVALSYVWGNPATSTRHGELPQVVKDSLAVCKALGYSYLWVDQYCNDQDNPDVLKKQVDAMNIVYGNAHLTIIAAAGEDSAYGLPGVGPRPRVTQQHLPLDKTLFIQTFPHASETLKTSKWASRGWTFQEGLLSNRKLIFTDHQVAFQCNGMHCCEAVYWPFQLMHAKSQNKFPQNVPAPPLLDSGTGRKFFNRYKPYLCLTAQIKEYSTRRLTKQEDRLKAVLGILADWEAREKDPIYHVWGVLVSPSFTPFRAQLREWEIRLGSWYHQKPCTRQPSFPSWSWTGWSGPITNTRHIFLATTGLFRTHLEKHHPTSGRAAPERIPLSTFVNHHAAHREYATGSSFLHLEVNVLDDITFTSVRWTGVSEVWKRAYYSSSSSCSRGGDKEDTLSSLEPRDDAFKDGIYAEFPHHRDGYVELSYFYADDINAAPLLPGQCMKMKAFLVESESTSRMMRFIVIAPSSTGGDYYERAGYLFCRGDSFQTHADITYRKVDGTLTKTRPQPPLRGDKGEDGGRLGSRLEDRLRRMSIRLG